MNIKRYKAVTLFEMLLVLAVSGMIGVAAFKYEYSQQQFAIADVYADKMYVFSQTVREFVRDNEDAMQAGTYVPNPSVTSPSTFNKTTQQGVTTYVFTGVSWLTDPNRYRPNSTIPYFSSPFTFNNMPPLELRGSSGRVFVKGDDAISVTVSGSDIMINYGLLFNASNPHVSAVPEGGVSAAAALKASELFDPLYGVSAFQYTGGVDKTGAPTPVIAQLYTPNALDVFVHPQEAFSGNILFPANAPAGSADIQNVQSIDFNSGSAINSSMGSVNQVQFSSSVPGTESQSQSTTGQSGTPTGPVAGGVINNLGVLNFSPIPGQSVINNAGVINFLAGSAISNLQTLNFATTPSGTITGLSQITFSTAPTTNFSGIAPAQTFSMYAASSAVLIVGVMTNDTGAKTGVAASPMSLRVVLADGSLPNTNTHFCAMSKLMRESSEPPGDKSCQLYTDASAVYNLTFNNMILCTVSCFRFATAQALRPMVGGACFVNNNGVQTCE